MIELPAATFGSKDFFGRDSKAFFDVADDIGRDHIAVPGEKWSHHRAEQDGTQGLEAVQRAGKIRGIIG